MYQNLLISLFGTVIGLVLVFALKPFIGDLFVANTESTHFESVEDFQRKMLERDDRDLQNDRSVSLRSIITPHLNSKIMFDLIPNLDVKFQRVPVRTNSCGMRGREVEIEKPDDTLRVLFLGDSFTFGWGVEEEESFPLVTERVLNRALGESEKKVEVLNMGIPGYSTFQQVELFLKRGVDFQPDIVVVFFIDNDFGMPFFIGGKASAGEVMTTERFAAITAEADDPELSKEYKKLLRALDPNKALKQLLKSGRRNGFEVFLAFNPHPNWKKSLKRLWVVRQSKNLHVIKIRERFLDAMDQYGIVAKDLSLSHDPHPSATKHALLGALIAESLLPEVFRIS